ncbi:uncharacterized protein CG4951 isoform X2 [Drosophila pseudoobscura]|uniref:Uncharacterized protein CG4951 isoform X2 n=1 Tax=Drosophila pseudoobscura pseudoobscura TaxID=46245 RepID=A0A6I8V6P7_DROPS|nr:uncharacterized protein CG4951 isoform X2 [Drosophila pseudoobscura]
MSFNAAGDYQLVMQTYKYKKHNIICSTKVLPSKINHFGKKLCDYHWMTPARWTNVESGLWDLLEKERDVQNVHADLLIDHIKVRVDSSEYRHSASQLLLPGVILSKSDLSLSVKLEYIPQEDTKNMRKGIDSSIKREVVASKASDHEAKSKRVHKDNKSSHGHGSRENKTTKRMHKTLSVDKQKEPAPETLKARSSRRSISQDSEKDKPSKPKPLTQSSLSIDQQIEPATETEKDKSIPPVENVPAKKRSSRRSISQHSERSKTSNRDRSSLEKKPIKRTQSSLSIEQEVERGQEKRKGRRSVSQHSGKEKASNSGRSSREKKPSKRTHIEAHPSSVGPSPPGRPRRSLTRPSHLDDFIVGRKIKTEKIVSPEKVIANGKGKDSSPSKPDPMEAVAALGLGPCPRKVDILLMDKMEKEEVLNTFSKYQSDLNQFFTEHRQERTDKFMGIQHVHVIDIMRRDVEVSMLEKLGTVFGNSSAYASLQINALLPLWIVRLFMDTFNFDTAEEAVQQIRDQLEYSTYQKAVNPLESDLEY